MKLVYKIYPCARDCDVSDELFDFLFNAECDTHEEAERLAFDLLKGPEGAIYSLDDTFKDDFKDRIIDGLHGLRCIYISQIMIDANEGEYLEPDCMINTWYVYKFEDKEPEEEPTEVSTEHIA